MNSPVYNAMGNQEANMFQQFKQFMGQMKQQGVTDPNEKIKSLLQSGKLSQAQLNQVQQQAQQMQGMFKGFFK